MNNEQLPLLAALEQIAAKLAENGAAPPQPLPTSLDRSGIHRSTSVFQTKDIEGRYAEDGTHVKNLKSLIGRAEAPNYLDPLTVWWGGDRWYLLDGHRRLKAYRLAGVQKSIPVTTFEGSLDEARAKSVALNSKDQMPMTTADKMNCAWKLILTTKLSRSTLMRVCSVSKGSIDNIRSVKTRLIEEMEMTLEEVAEMSWEAARAAASDSSKDPTYDHDAATERTANRILSAIVKAVGPMISNDTEAAALAFQKLDHRLPKDLMKSRAWWQSFREVVDDLKYEIGDDAEMILNALPLETPDDDY